MLCGTSSRVKHAHLLSTHATSQHVFLMSKPAPPFAHQLQGLVGDRRLAAEVQRRERRQVDQRLLQREVRQLLAVLRGTGGLQRLERLQMAV